MPENNRMTGKHNGTHERSLGVRSVGIAHRIENADANLTAWQVSMKAVYR